MKRISRRAVFWGAAAAVGVTATGVAVAVLPRTPHDGLKRLLRSRLDYLTISDDVLNAFVRDYMADRENRSARLGPLEYGVRVAAYGTPGVRNWIGIHGLERHLVAQFLLSTDFFREGADPKRPLTYWRYSDPYRIGCANQFAKLAL